MSKYIKMIVSMFAVMGIAVASYAADPLPGVSAYATDDVSPAFRIKYNGSDATATIQVTTNTIILIDGTVTTTVTATNDASAVMADVRAATNVSGRFNFEIENLGVLEADVLTGNFVVSAVKSVADGKWSEVGLLDTSRILQWNAVSYGDNVPERWLTSIYGCPVGTGDATVTVYIDDGDGYSEVDRFFQTSPIYVLASAAGTLTNNPTTADNTVNLNKFYSRDLVYGLRVPAKAKCLVRAARATTAGSGSVGATFTVK